MQRRISPLFLYLRRVSDDFYEKLCDQCDQLKDANAVSETEVVVQCYARQCLFRLKKNGITEFTSTLLRDKLGLDKEVGRDQVRRIMRKLEKDGKVDIGQKEAGRSKQYIYKLKESRAS